MTGETFGQEYSDAAKEAFRTGILKKIRRGEILGEHEIKFLSDEELFDVADTLTPDRLRATVKDFNTLFNALVLHFSWQFDQLKTMLTNLVSENQGKLPEALLAANQPKQAQDETTDLYAFNYFLKRVVQFLDPLLAEKRLKREDVERALGMLAAVFGERYRIVISPRKKTASFPYKYNLEFKE